MIPVDGGRAIWHGNSLTFSIAASGSTSESIDYVWPPADATVGGQALLSDGSGVLSFGIPSTSAAHNLMSGTHSDTTNSTPPARGSIIYGNATPAWDELTEGTALGGAATDFLGVDGTDVGYRTIAQILLDLGLTSTTDGSSGASLIGIPEIAGATYDQLEEAWDVFNASGLISGGSVTDGGGETVDVASLSGALRIANGHVASLVSFDFAGSIEHAIPTDTVRWVGIEYNAGTPQVVVKASDSWNMHNEFPLASVVNENTTLHIENNPQFIANFGAHALTRFYETMPVHRDDRSGGIILGETGTRYVTVTAGTLWDRVTEFTISAIDTDPCSNADTFNIYVGTTLDPCSPLSQWPNEFFFDDPCSTRQAMGVNKYGNIWFYIETDGDLVAMYGTSNTATQAAAELESAPTTLPNRISSHGKLIGRMIYQNGAASAADIQSVFTTTFTTTGVTDHGDLAGLADDDHTQYLLVTGGRALAGAWDMNNENLTNVDIDNGTVDNAIIGGGTPAAATVTALTANEAVILGDGGDNFSVASDGVDIDTSGNFTNVGNISGSDIDISAGTGDISTTGTLASGAHTFTAPSQDWLHTGSFAGSAWQAQDSATAARFQLYTKDGDGTDDANFEVYVGEDGVQTVSPGSIGDATWLRLGYDSAGTEWELRTEKNGSGTPRDLRVFAVGKDLLLSSGNNITTNCTDDLELEAGSDVRSTTVRDNMTGSAANMRVSTSSGDIERFTSSARYKTIDSDMTAEKASVVLSLRPRKFYSLCAKAVIELKEPIGDPNEPIRFLRKPYKDFTNFEDMAAEYNVKSDNIKSATLKGDDPNKVFYGLVAEEVMAVYPEAADEEGYDINFIMAALIKQVQVQAQKNADLTKRIEILEKL